MTIPLRDQAMLSKAQMRRGGLVWPHQSWPEILMVASEDPYKVSYNPIKGVSETAASRWRISDILDSG